MWKRLRKEVQIKGVQKKFIQKIRWKREDCKKNKVRVRNYERRRGVKSEERKVKQNVTVEYKKIE